MVIATRSGVSKAKSGEDEGYAVGRRRQERALSKAPRVEEEVLVEDAADSPTHEESEEPLEERYGKEETSPLERLDVEVVAKFIAENQERFLHFVRKSQDETAHQQKNLTLTYKEKGEERRAERQGSSKPVSPPRRGRTSISPQSQQIAYVITVILSDGAILGPHPYIYVHFNILIIIIYLFYSIKFM